MNLFNSPLLSTDEKIIESLKDIENKIKKIYALVEDRDLFKFKFAPDTHYFTSGFYDLNLELDPNKNSTIFNYLLFELVPNFEKLLQKGAEINKLR